MEETIAERLSGFTDELTFETILGKVIKKTKDLILDTLGICIASSKMDFDKAAIGLIAGWGGVPERSLIGSEAKVPEQNAAFANGVVGHGQDYDQTRRWTNFLRPWCRFKHIFKSAIENMLYTFRVAT